MPAAARPLAAAALLGAALACVPGFVCEEDAQCNNGEFGRCNAGTCEYGAAPATDTPGTSAAPTEVSEDGASATGPAAGCEEFDVAFDSDSGKATGVVLGPDGATYVVGVTSSDPYELRLKRLRADGAEDWTVVVAATDLGNTAFADRDTDIWARVFLDGDELIVAHSQRKDAVSEQDGVYIQRFALAGGSLGASDVLVVPDRSLRGAVMPGAGELLLAGETDDNVWYQRVTRTGDAWTPKWADPPGFTPQGTFDAPEIAQAIAAIVGTDEVMVGGTWDHDGELHLFRAWLRRVAAGGADACECTREGAGILALAAAGDESLYAGGFLQTAQADPMQPPQSELWLARVGASCPIDCMDLGSLHEPGLTPYTDFYRAEFVQDAIYALAPLGEGVLAGGTADNRPVVVRVIGDEETWRLPPSGAASKGAALALAVSDDESCLTIVGSADYSNYTARRWWVRRVLLP